MAVSCGAMVVIQAIKIWKRDQMFQLDHYEALFRVAERDWVGIEGRDGSYHWRFFVPPKENNFAKCEI